MYTLHIIERDSVVSLGNLILFYISSGKIHWISIWILVWGNLRCTVCQAKAGFHLKDILNVHLNLKENCKLKDAFS